MKKIKKLIVAILAMAMVIGCLAVQASAADFTKEVIFVLSDESVADEVLVQISSNVATCSSEQKEIPGWGGQQGYVTTSLGDGKYKLTLTATDSVSTDPNNYCSLKFVALKDNAFVKGQDVHTQNFADKYNAANTVYISMDMSKDGWVDGGGVSDITTTDPTAIVITAAECEAAITAIGTVELSEACRGKIDAAKAKINGFKGNTADISNYATYTAAEAKWNDLVAAGKGDLKLHIKHEWDAAAVYTYGVSNNDLHDAEDWPGTVVVNNAKNTGWTDVTITLTTAAHVIINNNNNGAETDSIKYMTSGEYWITVAADKSYTISKEAPAGWVSSSDAEAAADAEALIDTAIALDATKANKDKYDAALSAYNALSADQKKLVDTAKVEKLNAGVKAIADIIAKEQAEEDAKNAGTLTVYVKSPGWTVMNVYGWDGAEFGEWPGKSLTALKVNEGWFSVSFDITKATNLIFNDNKTNNEQTVNWEGVKAGTYWLVLSEKDGEGKYLVDALSTTAPEGWKEEAAEKVEQELPTSIKTVTEEEISAMKDAVKVEGSNDKLVVAPLDAASKDVAVLTTALAKELKGVKFIAADLKFESGKQPAEGTKITIDISKLAEVKSAKYVTVYSVKDSKLEKVDTVEAKDGKITFAPKHFSTYVFAEATNINEGPLGVPAAVVVASVSLMLAAVVAVIASKKRVTE